VQTENGRRYGKVKLIEEGSSYYLECSDDAALAEVRAALKAPEGRIQVSPEFRGQVKQILLKIGYPVVEMAGYGDASALQFNLNDTLSLRWYQEEAAAAFHAGGSVTGGGAAKAAPPA